jgi:hypothetical protein
VVSKLYICNTPSDRCNCVSSTLGSYLFLS